MSESGATGYPKLILLALERALRTDPAGPVRQKAAELFGTTAYQQKPRVCPLALAEDLLDPDENVRAISYVVASMVKEFAPGCRPVLLRCLKEGDSNTRAYAAELLPGTGKDQNSLRPLRELTRDKDFWVRESAYKALFCATDRLDEIVPYKFQVRRDWLRTRPPARKLTEAESREQAKKNLMMVSAWANLYLWAQERPGDMARILPKLMKHESPETRKDPANFLAGVAEEVPRLRGARPGAKVGGVWFVEFGIPLVMGQASAGGEPRETAEQMLHRVEKAVALLAQPKFLAGLQRLRDRDPEPSVRAAAAVALQELYAAKAKGPVGQAP